MRFHGGISPLIADFTGRNRHWGEHFGGLISIFVSGLYHLHFLLIKFIELIQVMASRPRSDIHINLPALQKLDTMLEVRQTPHLVDFSLSVWKAWIFIRKWIFASQEILDSFKETEFWYAEEGKLVSSNRAGSFRVIAPRPDEKWWLPVPCVPRGGMSEKARKELQHSRDCANQIHKAAMSINNSILAEMKIPDSYMAALPKVSPGQRF